MFRLFEQERAQVEEHSRQSPIDNATEECEGFLTIIEEGKQRLIAKNPPPADRVR